MKKLVSIIALATTLTVSANAQGLLGGLLGGDSTLSDIVSGLAGVVYSAPVSLNGTYTYNGIAVSATSSEGGILANLAGTAVTSGIESKIDGYLSKIGIVPGAAKFTFNADDNTFTLNVGAISLPGKYKVGDGEKTVTLTFGKTMQFFCMTGVLESSGTGAKMLFPVNKAVSFLKKLASTIGQSSNELGTIIKLADGYDNFKVGFKMSK